MPDGLKDAYDALDDTKKAYFKPVIDEMATDARILDLARTAHMPSHGSSSGLRTTMSRQMMVRICNTLVTDSATDQAGLLVYSKLRSVEESAGVSLNNIKVAAYQDATKASVVTLQPIYLFVTNNSPLPWTACAFIQYMTCTEGPASPHGAKIWARLPANPESWLAA